MLRFVFVLGVLLAVSPCGFVGAEEVPTADQPAPAPGTPRVGALELPENARVGRTRGVRVHLRVGPRLDNRPLELLDRGAPLLIVGEVYEWLTVYVPSGIAVTCASRYLEPVDQDRVRVTASRLNLRVRPPERAGGALAPSLQDQVARGDILEVLHRDATTEGWTWVLAPLATRVYVRADQVEIDGPAAAHPSIVEEGLSGRATQIASSRTARRQLAVDQAGQALRRALGGTQQELYRLREAAGLDRTPIVALSNALTEAFNANPLAPRPVQLLVVALLADLEAELELRVARKDAEVARIRDLAPEEPAPLTPVVESVRIEGRIRWEAAPRWRAGGAFLLWQEGLPRYVLRLSTKTPRPHPDLKALCDGNVRVILGKQTGERVFGLPAIDIMSVAEGTSEASKEGPGDTTDVPGADGEAGAPR